MVLDSFTLRERFICSEFVDKFRKSFESRQGVKDEAILSTAYITGSPFPVVVLPDLFSNDEPLIKAKEELLSLEFVEKCNDLYEYWASTDLKNLKANDYPALCALKEKLFGQKVLDLIKGITGFEELNGTIDLGGQRYKKGGNLLCHDDDLEGRRIAFILYLVDSSWTEKDGGQLDLFSHDPVSKLPRKVENCIVPRWNTLAFFEVTKTSYHQVREILSSQHERVSITGWFHGKVPERILSEEIQVPKYPPLLSRTVSSSELTLSKWLAPEYLNPAAWKSIREIMLEESTVDLNQFLHPSVYEEIMGDALESNRQWTTVGPWNLCHYEKLTEVGDGILGKFLDFLSCSEFAQFLHEVTNLDFTGNHFVSVAKFQKSCYTLLHDASDDDPVEGLDVIFSFPTDQPHERGGQIHYVQEEETLLSLDPKPNACSLVVRDEGVYRFTKYIPSDYKGSILQISLIYQLK